MPDSDSESDSDSTDERPSTDPVALGGHAAARSVPRPELPAPATLVTRDDERDDATTTTGTPATAPNRPVDDEVAAVPPAVRVAAYPSEATSADWPVAAWTDDLHEQLMPLVRTVPNGYLVRAWVATATGEALAVMAVPPGGDVLDGPDAAALPRGHQTTAGTGNATPGDIAAVYRVEFERDAFVSYDDFAAVEWAVRREQTAWMATRLAPLAVAETDAGDAEAVSVVAWVQSGLPRSHPTYRAARTRARVDAANEEADRDGS